MHIGFDAKRALQNFTGLGNYSRFVIEALSDTFPGNRYYLYSPEPAPPEKLFTTNTSIQVRTPKSSQFKAFWRSKGIISDLKHDRIQIYHGLSNELPFGLNKTGIKSIVTIHDLIFLRYPEYFPWVDRNIYRLKFKYACKHADKIIAVSEQTKRDIISFFEIPDNRIEVVYQDCAPHFQTRYQEEEKLKVKEKYQLPEKYLLNVGTVEERKNLLLIAQALKKLPEGISLVVVGKETAYAEKVKVYLHQNKLTNRVRFLRNVAFNDLPLIYQQAEIFIYPSRFEGFGIPIIEALHSGVPVIAATGSCLEEAGGKGSLYVDPNDPDSLTDAITRLLSNKDKRMEMSEIGYRHVLRFSKERIADQLITVYQRLLDNA